MQTHRPTVLLVDDEPMIRESVKRALRKDNLDFPDANNGEEALCAVAKNQTDLIILDLQMPVMDGFTFLDQFRNLHDDRITPVCVMTGGAGQDDRRRAIDMGADDFIRKPADTIELETRIKSLLRISRYQREMHDLNSRLEEKVDARTSELCASLYELKTAQIEIDLAYRETVLRLTLAAEMKDECTSGHLERMSHYSAKLAERCGWSSRDVDLMKEAAKMHDIGKLGIPDAILNKPGKLTEHEFATMRQHTEIGARILEGSRSQLLKMARVIALSHHERFDGAGYPFGLSGEDIPIAGRIVAIGDVFDALTSRRSYKNAWPLEEAAATMREQAGKHFDPVLLDRFFEEAARLREIHERFKQT